MPDAARCAALGDVRTVRWPVRRLARVLRRDAELLDAFREALALDFYARGRRPAPSHVDGGAARRLCAYAVDAARASRGTRRHQSNAQAKLEREEAAARENDQSPLPPGRPSAARLERRKKAASVSQPSHVRYGGRSRRRSPRRLDAQDAATAWTPSRTLSRVPAPFVSSDDDLFIDRVASDEIRGRVAVRGGHVAAARRPITQKGVPIPRKDRAELAEHALLRCCGCFHLPFMTMVWDRSSALMRRKLW